MTFEELPLNRIPCHYKMNMSYIEDLRGWLVAWNTYSTTRRKKKFDEIVLAIRMRNIQNNETDRIEKP